MNTRKSRGGTTGRTSAEADDGLRGQFGVVASLVHRPDGTVRVVLDDVRAAGNGLWEREMLFTWRDYPTDAFLALDLDDSEFQNAGLSLYARLQALAARRGAAR